MAKHVLVAGSLFCDRVVQADRLPAADEFVESRSQRRLPGGKAQRPDPGHADPRPARRGRTLA